VSVSLRPRSLGEILDGAVRLVRADIGVYALTAIVCFAPIVMFSVYGLVDSDSTALFLVFLALFPFALVGAFISWTAITHQMNLRLDGEAPTLKAGILRGLRLILRLVGVSIVAFIAMLVAFTIMGFVAALVVGGLSLLGETIALVTGVLVMIGFGVTFTVLVVSRFFLVLPVLVIEGTGVIDTFKRSSELSRGARIPITALFVVTWILLFLPTVAIAAVTGTLGESLSPASATMTVPLGTAVIQQGLSLLVTGVTTPFMVAVMLLTYYDRRIRGEGFDLESAAEELLGE